MSPIQVYAALTTLLATGCASSPEIAADASTAEAALVANAEEGTAPAAEGATIVPDKIVDANDLVARTPAPVICRQMLKQGSNVIIQQCMTEQNWKRFELRQAQEAQELVRTLQGGRYR